MNGPSILIVEDEAIIAADLTRQLKQLGYTVVGSLDRGEEAVATARRARPSLIMMDIRLAGEMDGIEAALAIRRDMMLPVVFLTAHCDATTIERAGLSDAFGYILKPFDERELRVQIEMALRQHATEQQLLVEKQQLSASLMTAQEEERRRVSRELHDDLGQKVALIELHAARMEQDIKRGPTAVPIELIELRKQTAELAQDLRSIAFRLHPSILEDLGLAIALRRLVENFSKTQGLQAFFSNHNVPEKLSPQTAGALYRITQEALRNIARHAGQTRVSVSLRGLSRELRLQIRDHGSGFDPVAVRGRGGMGILNMEERMRMLGGQFQLQSSPGGGVRITASVPLQPKSVPARKPRRSDS